MVLLRVCMCSGRKNKYSHVLWCLTPYVHVKIHHSCQWPQFIASWTLSLCVCVSLCICCSCTQFIVSWTLRLYVRHLCLLVCLEYWCVHAANLNFSDPWRYILTEITLTIHCHHHYPHLPSQWSSDRVQLHSKTDQISWSATDLSSSTLWVCTKFLAGDYLAIFPRMHQLGNLSCQCYSGAACSSSMHINKIRLFNLCVCVLVCLLCGYLKFQHFKLSALF